jgi:gas vesicle protein
MENRGSGIVLVAGIAAGILLGAIIALILASKSGSENRDMLKEKAQDVGDRIKEATADRKQVYTETWKSHKGKYKARHSEA